MLWLDRKRPWSPGSLTPYKTLGSPVFGPGKEAAQLEGSKGFTKDLCARYNIPTAAYGRFSDAASAKAYLTRQSVPIVIKADGLAAGKGVTVAGINGRGESGDRCLFRWRVRRRGRGGRDRSLS